MSIDEEIDAERKIYESDTAWETRRAFLAAHWGDYSHDQLECYSQLFINITMIGCEYSPSIMEKIKEMSAGIKRDDSRLHDERKYVKASRGRAVAQEIMQKEREERNDKDAAQKTENFVEKMEQKLRTLRGHMLQAMVNTEPLLLMNMSGRVQLSWRITKPITGFTELYLGDLLVFQHKFIHMKEPRDEILTSVVDSFIVCEPAVNGKKEVTFDGALPSECYTRALRRRFVKCGKTLPANSGFKALSDALSHVGIRMEQENQQLQGWSQQVTITAGEVLLCSKVLTKGECVPAKAAQVVDESLHPIVAAFRNGSFDVKIAPSGLLTIAV